MAISAVHYTLLKEHAPLLVRGGSLLEIGEANWYGDIEAPEGCDLNKCIRGVAFSGFENDREVGIIGRLREEIEWDLFAVAKEVYGLLFAPSIVEAVDIHGPSAMKQDLNRPLTLPRQYDTIINHGTAEHIFDIAQVFKSMHDAAKVGGYMIHECPFTGWVDHGFYCLQPTLFYDIAAANEYELVSLSIAEIQSRTIIRVESREKLHELVMDRNPNINDPTAVQHRGWYHEGKYYPVPRILDNSLLFVVLRKVVDAEFRVPMQGVYSQRLSEKGREAWATLR